MGACASVSRFEPPPHVLEWRQRTFLFHKVLGYVQFR